MSRRESFTARRRRMLALHVAALEVYEGRHSIGDLSSPLGLALQAVAGAGLLGLVRGRALPAEVRKAPGATTASSSSPPFHLGTSAAPPPPVAVVPLAIVPPVRRPLPGTHKSIEPAGDWLTLEGRDQGPTRVASAAPLPGDASSQPMSARGNAAGAVAPRGAITPLRIAPRATMDAGPPASAFSPPPILAGALGGPGADLVAAGGTASTSGADAGPAGGSDGSPYAASGFGGGESGGGLEVESGLFDVVGLDSAVTLGDFDHFVLHTLDYNYGTVLFPGFVHYATLAAPVDLRAQVRDDVASAYTFSWDTSDIDGTIGTDYVSGGTTGAATYRLRFTWTNSNPVAATKTVTLTATQTATGEQEVQTYSFRIPVGSVSGSGGGSAPTWPEAVGGDLLLADTPAFASHHGQVDAGGGAFGTSIRLPAYGPNLPGLTFAYDSLAADPRPMVLERHTLDDTLAVPSKTSAQLTFDGTAGSTYYYDTGKLLAGDIAQFALQADATALATGRYDYTATVADYRTTTTTRTVTGKLNVINEASSDFGAGWTLAGLARVYEVTGGVVLSLGAGGRSLWFASSGSGGAYTTPKGDFSTLAKAGSGGSATFTRTLPDGTLQVFRSDGRQTASVDRNGLRVTFSYDGSSRLQTILDPYSQRTTFAYDGSGKLATVTDPAGRVATFTVASGKLTGVTLPDNSTWGYAYDGSKRLTEVTDPRTQRVTVAYDAAGRVGTVTRPDSSVQTVDPYQEAGYDTSGTSGSPAPATLLAEARATHVDPNGNAADVRTDWNGLGRMNQATDAAGNVATAYVNTNGLATVSIDRLNRIGSYKYDAKGNVTEVTHPDGNRATFTYNGFSQVTEAVDERNNRTTFTYDGEGNLTGIRDAMSNRTTLTYTANGRVESAKDPRGNLTTYQYDSQDRVTTITHPAVGGSSGTTLFAYDAKGNVATVTSERGHSTTYSYDAMNRVTGEKDALGNRTTSTYDSGGNRTVVQLPTPAGQTARTTTYAYDAMNRVLTITAPLSRVTVLGYDSGGRVVTVADPLSRVTTATFDVLDRVTVVTSPQAGATVRRVTLTYDAEGQVLTQADHLNRVTTSTYHSRGWVQTVTDPLGNVATYTYSATGKVSSQTDPVSGGSSLVQLNYDAADRLESVVDALGHRTTTVYDSGGNVVAKVDALGNRTTFTYDARNRVETVKDPLSNVTTYGYDAAGNVTSVVNPLSKTTQYAFDALNRATTITDALTGVVALSFDEAGRNTVVIDPVTNRTTFAYDAADRVTTQTDALGTVTFSYDLADQLTGRTDRLGRRVTFAYDSGGRMTNEWWLSSGGSVERRITYTYDAADQLTQAADPDATLSFTYDSGGRQLTARTSGGGSGQPDVTLTAGYDALGKRTSLTDNFASVGRTTYAYDAAQRLTTITRSLGGTEKTWVKFSYDDADRRTRLERTIGGSGTKILTTLTYDNASRVTTITHGVSGGAALATFAYGYDSGGRIVTETNAEGLATYSYDDIDQLTGVDRPVGQTDESFGYDPAGNRNTTGYTTTTGNRQTASPGYTYGYDAEGNMTSRVQLNGAGTSDDVMTTFSYDQRNRLTGARTTTNAGVETMRATYTYDAVGRRIKVQADADGAGAGGAVTTWTVYDDVNTYADVDSAGVLQTRYLYGQAVDELLARTDSGGASEWYLTDRLGSVRDIVSTAGASVYHAAYEAFGGVASETGAGGDRFKFTGREWDANARLQYNRARWYNPGTGRWTSLDPIGFYSKDANHYRYCHNDPANSIDPTGLFRFDDPGGQLTPGAYGGYRTGIVFRDPPSTTIRSLTPAELGYVESSKILISQHLLALEAQFRINKQIEKADEALKMYNRLQHLQVTRVAVPPYRGEWDDIYGMTEPRHHETTISEYLLFVGTYSALIRNMLHESAHAENPLKSWDYYTDYADKEARAWTKELKDRTDIDKEMMRIYSELSKSAGKIGGD